MEDQDDFARHRTAYSYPDDVVREAEATCARILAAVRDGTAPFDGTHQPWLDLLRELRPS